MWYAVTTMMVGSTMQLLDKIISLKSYLVSIAILSSARDLTTGLISAGQIESATYMLLEMLDRTESNQCFTSFALILPITVF